MANTRRIKSKTVPINDRYVASKRTVDAYANLMLGGMMTQQGRIIAGYNNGHLVYGGAKWLSPGYRRYVDDITMNAEAYPVNDPRTWMPLVRAGMKTGELGMQVAMEADYDTLAMTGQTTTPYNVPRSGSARPALGGAATDVGGDAPATPVAVAPEPVEEEGDGGNFFSDAIGALGDVAGGAVGLVGGGIDAADEAISDVLSPGEDIAAASRGVSAPEDDEDSILAESAGTLSGGLLGAERHLPVIGNAPHRLTKAVSRNSFAAMNMSYQAIVGTGANIADDLSKGDYKSALLHAYGAFPLAEAGFIAAENVTGTDFYREGGQEPTNWAQTDMGQVLLEIGGQGKGENLPGGADDAAGFGGIDQGDGFFINPDSQIGQAQEAARLQANTVVEEQPITDADAANLLKIANMEGEEQALAYAHAQGWEFNALTKEFVTPAQGWTFGRALALTFTDPNTEAYKNFSGVVDFGSAIFADPVNWVPAGGIKAVVGGAAKGGRIVQKGSTVEMFDADGARLVIPENLDEMTDEHADFIANAMAEGGSEAYEQGWNWLRSQKGQERVRGIVEETSPYQIYKKSGGKFDGEMADNLANARTDMEVMRLIAPRIGVDVTYSNDLARFATKMPSLTTGTQIAKAADIQRVKDSLVETLPSMRFMPGHEMDIENMGQTVDQLQRWAGVAIRDIEKDADYINAMDGVIRTYAGTSGRASRAQKFQAIYGRRGDEYLADDQGNIIMTIDELKHQREVLGPENPEYALITDEALAAKGFTVEATQQDGVFATLAKKMADRYNLPPSLAHSITRAWDEGELDTRLYAQDGAGGSFLPPWSEKTTAEPFLEVDVLSRMASLPDAAAMRQHIQRTGSIVDHMMKSDTGALRKTGEVMRAADDLATMAVYRWKQIALMGFGLRYPAYAMRQTFDTQMTATLAGGNSILRSPRDFLGLLMTSAIRETTDGERGLRHLNAKLARDANPLTKMLFRYNLHLTDAEGQRFDEGLRKARDGDANGMDDMWLSLNAHAGARGSLGQDVLYNVKPGHWVQRDKSNAAHLDDYVGGIAEELHKLSLSPTARRIANPAYSLADNVSWFMKSLDDSGRDVVGQFGPSAANFLDNPKGVQDYLLKVNDYVKMVTGNDESLLGAVAHGRFDEQDMLIVTPGKLDRNVNTAMRNHINTMLNGENTLPPSWKIRPMTSGQEKSQWDAAHRLMFHSSGQWEDVYARDPFYRTRHGEHVEDIAHMMDPIDRAAMAKAYREAGNKALARRIEKVKGNGILTRKEVNDIAHKRASDDVLDIAYDAANRREWAYAMRLVSPFVQAAVNGMYRWAKHAVQNPESTYRLQRAGNFLTNEDSAVVSDLLNDSGNGLPVIYEDPTTGERRIMVPLIGQMAEAFGLPEDAAQLASISASSMNLAFPNYERVALQEGAENGAPSIFGAVKMLWPGVGPVVTLPASFLVEDQDGWVADFLTPYGAGEGSGTDRLTEMLLPRSVTRIINAVNPGAEEEAKRAREVAMYASMLMKEENTDLLDQAAVDAVWDRARSMANTMAIVSALGNLGTPSSLSLDAIYKNPADIPDHAVGAQLLSELLYDNYLPGAGNDYDKAQAEMIADWGVSSLLFATPKGPNSDAAPPTYGISSLKEAYPEGYAKYGPVLTHLIPDSGFDVDLYASQIASGERTRLSLDERKDLSMQALYSYVWNYRTTLMEAATGSDMAKTAEKNMLRRTLVDAGWKGMPHGRSVEERQIEANLMLQASRDPEMAPFLGGMDGADLIERYLTTRERMIRDLQGTGTSGDLYSSTTAGASQRFSLFTMGESFALRNKGFHTVWWNTLRGEVVNQEEVE